MDLAILPDRKMALLYGPHIRGTSLYGIKLIKLISGWILSWLLHQ